MQISQSPQRIFSNWLLFLLSVCFLLGTWLKVAAVADATWPTFQSNNQRNAFVDSMIDPAELRQAWIIRSSEPPQPAWHGPAKWDAYANLRGLHSMRNYDPVFHISAAGEQIYFGSSVENSVMCLDAASGKRRWTFFTNGPVRIQPTLAQGRIYFGSDDGYAYCLRAEDGELIWRFRPSHPERLIPNNGNFIPLWPVRTGVTVSENTAYFAASLLPWHVTYLCAVDATTGRVTQPEHFVKEHQGLTVEGPLALSNDFVIAPQGRVEPMLFARETGKQVGKLEGGGGAFVVVADQQILHGPGNKEGWLTQSDAATRERMATHKNARAIVAVDGTSYLLTSRAVVAIAGSDKSSKWQTPCRQGLAMIAAGDFLVVGGLDSVTAFARADGTKVWEHPVEGRAFGLAVASGRLLVSTDTGTFHAFETKPVGEFTATSNSEATGAIHDTNRVLEQSVPPRQSGDRRLTGRLSEPAGDTVPQNTWQLKVGPWLEFVDRDEAHVYWTSRQPSPSILAYQLGETIHKVVDPMPKINHMLKMSGLKRNRIYHYAVEVEYDGKRQRTSDHQCDTFFNYRPVTVTSNGGTAGKLAEAVLERVQVSSGICALIGINNSGLAVALASQSDLRVIMFVEDKTQAEMLRREIEQTGAYGSRVSVLLTEPNDPLPLTPHCLNLVVAAINPASAGIAEKATHCLASTGRALWIENPARLSLDAIASAGLQDAEPLAGAGEWTHAYGRADNSAFGGESLAGARSQKDLVVQWIGRPGPRYQSDRSGRKSPPLAVAGRVFLQGLNRIIAVDSFNGTIHWSLEVPYFQRMNLPRDTSNWCADRHHIYAAVRDHCWKINVADGTVVDTWAVQDYLPGQGRVDWGYVSSAGEQLIGSVGHEGSSWTDFWGGAGWYDEATGERAHKVCSRAIFGLHKLSGSPLWKYTRGVIFNSTITVGDGRVCFVESREPTIVAKKQGRFGSTELWQAQHLVALDSESGKLLWEIPIDTVDGETAFCMAYSDNRFVIVSSANLEFHISTFDATTGQPTWTNRSAWGTGEADHGTHLSRPAIAGNRLYVRPAVFDLETGKKLPSEMPIGGCGTYACTDSALFFRGGPGVLSVWNSQDGSYTHWPRLRPDCWLSSIPADGLLLSPEGGGGCSCGKWLETSLAFIPRVHLQH